MPIITARCKFCLHSYKGPNAIQLAEACENNGPPEYLYEVGEEVANFIIVEKIVYLDQKTKTHLPRYRVEANGLITKHLEKQLRLLAEEMQAHQAFLKQLNDQGVPSVMYKQLKYYKTSRGWYADHTHFGHYLTKPSEFTARLDQLFAKEQAEPRDQE